MTAQEVEIARAMIAAKIRNARTLLGRKGVTGTNVLKDLGVRAERVETKDNLRGVEGEAAERYFARLDETLTDGWTFEIRSKRPPEDHINSLLSTLRQLNLDPFLGVLHADRHGCPSLALDLEEEFRPIFCDAFVMRLVSRGTISHDQFTQDNHLADEAFDTYVEKFDAFI